MNEIRRRSFFYSILGVVTQPLFKEPISRGDPPEIDSSSQFDWPTYSYDKKNSGYKSVNVPNEGPLNRRWQFQTEEAIQSSPAIVDGTVFFGSNTGSVFALNAATGQTEWEFEANGAVTSSPSVSNGRVFVGGSDGFLYSLISDSGEKAWKSEVPGQIWATPSLSSDHVFVGTNKGVLVSVDRQTGEQVWSSTGHEAIFTYPAIDDDSVYFMDSVGDVTALSREGELNWKFETGTYLPPNQYSSPAIQGETIYLGGHDGNVYALDKISGDEKWVYETDLSWVPTSPAITENSIIVGGSNGVIGIDIQTGKKVWGLKTNASVTASPVVVNKTIYIVTNHGVVHMLKSPFNLEKEAPHWTYDIGSNTVSAPSVAYNTLYFGDQSGSLNVLEGSSPPLEQHSKGNWPMYRFDERNTGNNRSAEAPITGFGIKWQNLFQSRINVSPVVEEGSIFVGTYDGSFWSLNEEDGKIQWELPGIEPFTSSPAVAGDHVFIGKSNILLSISKESGGRHWEFEMEGPIIGSPTVVNGTVYCGSQDENLYAFNQDGTLQWKFDTEGYINGAPAIENRTLYVGSAEGSIYAIGKDGKKRWEKEISGGAIAPLAIDRDTIYFGSTDGAFYALDTADGGVVWRFMTSGEIEYGAALGEKTVIFADDNNNTYGLDLQSGSLRWHVETDTKVTVAPTIANGFVYIVTEAGVIHIINDRTGAVIETFDLDVSVTVPLVPVEGSLYVCTSRGNLFAITGESSKSNHRSPEETPTSNRTKTDTSKPGTTTPPNRGTKLPKSIKYGGIIIIMGLVGFVSKRIKRFLKRSTKTGEN